MLSRQERPWSLGEDAYLIYLIHTKGGLNWVRIAQLNGSRSPKQCRERYDQNLNPSLYYKSINPEGLQIERPVTETGKHWTEIERRMQSESDVLSKNSSDGKNIVKSSNISRLFCQESSSKEDLGSSPGAVFDKNENHYAANERTEPFNSGLSGYKNASLDIKIDYTCTARPEAEGSAVLSPKLNNPGSNNKAISFRIGRKVAKPRCFSMLLSISHKVVRRKPN